MTIYIDQPRHRLGRMVMCHMAADTLTELHAMAGILGVRRWFQDKPGAPHYDICKATRARALRLGAVEVSSRTLLQAARRAATQPAPSSLGLSQGSDHAAQAASVPHEDGGHDGPGR